jgi:hypothetical protein
MYSDIYYFSDEQVEPYAQARLRPLFMISAEPREFEFAAIRLRGQIAVGGCRHGVPRTPSARALRLPIR